MMSCANHITNTGTNFPQSSTFSLTVKTCVTPWSDLYSIINSFPSQTSHERGGNGETDLSILSSLVGIFACMPQSLRLSTPLKREVKDFAQFEKREARLHPIFFLGALLLAIENKCNPFGRFTQSNKNTDDVKKKF